MISNSPERSRDDAVADRGGKAAPPRRAGASSDRSTRRRGFISRGMLLGLLGLLLAWLVLSNSLTAYLADTAPQAARHLSPGHPVALLEIAERAAIAEIQARAEAAHMNRQRQAKADTAAAGQRQPAVGSAPAVDRATIKDFARRALIAEPFSAHAIRILGLASDLDDDQPRATRLLATAAKRSLHDSTSLYLTMVRSYEAADYSAALAQADLLSSTRPDLIPAVVPLLTLLAENPASSDLLKKRLAARPAWRTQFFYEMRQTITDARTPLNLMMGMKAAGDPPSAEELRQYLGFLLSRNFHEIAYYAWLQFLPMEQLAVTGHLFNGNFDFPISGLPFDWTISQGVGASVDIVVPPGDGGNRALKVELISGRVQLGEISQRLMLPPGKYVLKAKFRGEVAGRRGMRWRLACSVDTSKVLTETGMFIGVQRSWRDIEAAFSVPDNECRAQIIRLVHDARYSAEQFVTGTIWFDDLVITRQ